MNKVFLIGRLSRDPELRHTTSGTAVCQINVAISRPVSQGSEPQTDFINVVVWNKQAENLVKYQSKGSLISVEGSNRVDKYQNEQGENRYKHYILVNNIQFLESKKDVVSEPKKEDVEPFTPVDDFNEDDYPF